MRTVEPDAFDTHEPIDLSDPAKVREMTLKLECSAGRACPGRREGWASAGRRRDISGKA